MKEAPMTISNAADLYSVLPKLYELVQSHIGRSPTASFDDAIGRVECETLEKLIDTLDLLIAITPAITGN